jgi:ferritin-like metal-binding protein YciE
MSLQEMLLDEIRDLYHAEKQLIKALPKMAKGATHEDLRDAFETHLEETREQVTRLEEVFGALGEKVRAKPCPGMAGILEEGSELLQEEEKGAVLDAALIASAQRAEHYEIGAYGTCAAWARLLGLDEVVTLLEQTLEEEKATDKKLTALAEQEVNQSAAADGQNDNEGEGDQGGDNAQRTASSSRGRSSGRSNGNSRGASSSSGRGGSRGSGRSAKSSRKR